MHSLFNNPREFNYGSITLPSWNNARTNLYTEINKLAQYYRTSREMISNNNILVRILKSDNTLLYKDADNTIDSARERWLKDAEMFGINTVNRKANSLPSNIAYPSNVREYLVMDDSIPIGNEVKLKWEHLEPIKVLDHPYNDLNLSIPNGKYKGDNVSGSVFLTINIPLLILQYRLWQKYEATKTGIDPDDASVFIMRYPLFNIINSHMDCIIRNRLVDIYHDNPLPPFTRIMQGGVAVNDTSNYVDRALRYCVQQIKNADLSFRELHQQIPQLSYTNVSESLILPEMSFTRTVRWVYDASRVRWYCFLLEYNDSKRTTKNLADIDYIKRRLRYMESEKDFQMAVGLNSNTHYHRLKTLIDKY